MTSMKITFRRITRISMILISIMFLQDSLFGQTMQFRELKSEQDWQKAMSDAKSSAKDIFLDIYATWCGPCKMMDANVFSDSAVAGFYNSNYINLKIDGESEFGTVMVSRYRLTGYPTMYYINPDEKLIYEAVGYRVPDALIQAGINVKESGKRYLELIDLFNTSILTDAQTEEFFTLLTKFEQKELLVELAGEKIKTFTEEDVLRIENKALLMAAGGNIMSLPVKVALKNAASMKLNWGEQDFNTYLSEAFNSSMQVATETADSLLMESIATEFVPVYMVGNPGRIPEAQLTTRKIYFSEVNDWGSYIQAVEKHYNDFENGNQRFLYLESYYIVENQLFDPQLLDKSNEWMEKVILAQPGFDTYFLAAIINTYRENEAGILKYMNLAEGVAVSQDEKDSLEELKRYLEEQ